MKFFNRFMKKKEPEVEQTASTITTPLNDLELKDVLMDGETANSEEKLQRVEAYVERPVQQLLRTLLESQTEIVPTYDFAGRFYYALAEKVLDDVNPTKAETEHLLDRLFQLDILKKQFFDTVSVCPRCQSAALTLHTRCPKCAKRNIVKTSLTEHIPCGNIDEREKYVEDVCPKCGEKLIQGQYRNMGRWYICRSCHERFEMPKPDLICRTCGNEFTIENAVIQTISKYALNPTRESEIRQNVTSLEQLHALLTELGFTVEMPGSMIGDKSGIRQYFSIIATMPEQGARTIVIDHSVNEPEVNASQLILYLYKLSEVHVDLPIFVAIPRLSDTAKRIAEGYQIVVVEGTPDPDQVARLKSVIQDRLAQKEEAYIGAPEAGELLPTVHDKLLDIYLQSITRRGKVIKVWRKDDGKFTKKPHHEPEP